MSKLHETELRNYRATVERTWRSLDGQDLFPDEFSDANLLNTMDYISRRYCHVRDMWNPVWEALGYPQLEISDVAPIFPALFAEARRRGFVI